MINRRPIPSEPSAEFLQLYGSGLSDAALGRALSQPVERGRVRIMRLAWSLPPNKPRADSRDGEADRATILRILHAGGDDAEVAKALSVSPKRAKTLRGKLGIRLPHRAQPATLKRAPASDPARLRADHDATIRRMFAAGASDKEIAAAMGCITVRGVRAHRQRMRLLREPVDPPIARPREPAPTMATRSSIARPPDWSLWTTPGVWLMDFVELYQRAYGGKRGAREGRAA